MIRETMIDAERDYVDERLFGLNDMTFEEWERYQDFVIKYYGWYLSDGLYEEEYEDYESGKEYESSDEDDEWGGNCRSCLCNNDLCLSRVTSPRWHPGQNEDDKSDDENHDRVCLCDTTDFRVSACCFSNLGPECDGQCLPDGYDRWLEARRATL